MKQTLPPGLVPERTTDEGRRQQEQVVAWAWDTRTNALRYILELTASENGAACACTCIGCGHPLQAINAGKTDFKIRPHFRHDHGATTGRCQTISARAALLAALQLDNWIVLPQMRYHAVVHGLSGRFYEGWVDVQPQRVRVRHLHFIDITTAEVTLDDGRRVQVRVTGSADLGSEADTAGLVPRIEIAADDPLLASLDPAALRALLTPAMMAGIWCSRWPDPELDDAARALAFQAAADALDWDDEELDYDEHVSGDMRRESLLHKEVKAILASAECIMVPGFECQVGGQNNQETHGVVTRGTATQVRLSGARLEKKMGRVIPDVIAQLADGGELLIEVTVTNAMTTERLARIRAVNLPTLEIDFSAMSGMLRRNTLRGLVLDEITGKRWLHHPSCATVPLLPPLDDDLLYGDIVDAHPERRRRWMLDTPAEEWARRYVGAVIELARLDLVIEPKSLENWPSAQRDAYDTVVVAADALCIHGFPEALDYRLYDDGHTVLHRLLSICTGSPVGYKYGTVWQVVNTLLTEVGAAPCSWHGLYLIALQAYPPALSTKQQALVDAWRKRVRDSILTGEARYLRDGRYDALFGLIFPEMRPRLAKPAARLPAPDAPPPQNRRDDSMLSPELFSPSSTTRWFWTMSHDERVRRLELEASRARTAGWTVDHSSLLYHLTRARFGAFVRTVAEHVAVTAGVSEVHVWRYLYREGYIQPSSAR